jgi:hypothetical protein
MLIPAGFMAYARIFHPAYLSSEAASPIEVRWADVAHANGRMSHPAMEWASITGDWCFLTSGGQTGIWDRPPAMGQLPIRQVRSLIGALRLFTRTPDHCWFGVWNGRWGGQCPIPAIQAGVAFATPLREMKLLTGPLSALTELTDASGDHAYASVWWPDDRAWCVATDVDLLTTYVGGSRECIETLVRCPDMEAYEVPYDQGITWDSDALNPLPSGGPNVP